MRGTNIGLESSVRCETEIMRGKFSKWCAGGYVKVWVGFSEFQGDWNLTACKRGLSSCIQA